MPSSPALTLDHQDAIRAAFPKRHRWPHSVVHTGPAHQKYPIIGELPRIVSFVKSSSENIWEWTKTNTTDHPKNTTEPPESITWR